MALRSVCVFCASTSGNRPEYRDAAVATGEALARRGIGLVYGGATVGLMGVVASAALAAGGTVVGVVPEILVEKEIAHMGCTELLVVDTMHTRKATMAERADGFLVLPGGPWNIGGAVRGADMADPAPACEACVPAEYRGLLRRAVALPGPCGSRGHSAGEGARDSACGCIGR